MKKLILPLVVLLMLFTGCGKKDTPIPIPDTSVNENQEALEILHETEDYIYHIEKRILPFSDIYSEEMKKEPDVIREYEVRIISRDKETLKDTSISDWYTNMRFAPAFSSEGKTFFSSTGFHPYSESFSCGYFCLDVSKNSFEAILSGNAIYLASDETTAYFYDFVDAPILISVELLKLQSKYLIDLPDLLFTPDSEFSGELVDTKLHIKVHDSAIITDYLIFDTTDPSYKLSDNYKNISFYFDESEIFAYNSETYEPITVKSFDGLMSNGSYDFLDFVLYSSYEYVDNGSVFLHSREMYESNRVFLNTDEIEKYVYYYLKENVYSFNNSFHSYSDYKIIDMTRTETDSGTSIFTYKFTYTPTNGYAIILNDNNPVSKIEEQTGEISIETKYIFDKYVMQNVSSDFNYDESRNTHHN